MKKYPAVAPPAMKEGRYNYLIQPTFSFIH